MPAVLQNDLDSAWIETYTGKKFFLLNPRVEDIDILDIAHGLSLQCRWTGQCRFHYSIAQHSYYCSFIGPKEEALERLLHDASESFMGDMNRPLKHFTDAGKSYRKQEQIVQNAIRERFGLSLAIEAPSVHIADNQMLFCEKQQLMTTLPWDDVDWLAHSNSENLGTAGILIEQWSPSHAETMFLNRFQQLYKVN